VTTYRDPATVYGSDEWCEKQLRWSRNTVKSAEADCIPLAEDMPYYRQWCERHGVAWPEFCRSKLDADAEWIGKIEEGVAILKGRGHRGPLTADAAAQAVAEKFAEAEPVKAPGAPKGNRNAAKSRDENNGSASTIEPKRRDAEYLLGRVKAKAENGDPVAIEVVERINRGEVTSARQAAREAGVLKPVDPVKAAVRAAEKLSDEQRETVTHSIARCPLCGSERPKP
jgi:hypothetical protein